MKPVYVLVHASTILEAKETDSTILKPKIEELERILESEDFFIVEGNPFAIPKGIPKEREVLVCGGLGEGCVAWQCMQLLEAGYQAEIYSPATISFSDAFKPAAQ